MRPIGISLASKPSTRLMRLVDRPIRYRPIKSYRRRMNKETLSILNFSRRKPSITQLRPSSNRAVATTRVRNPGVLRAAAGAISRLDQALPQSSARIAAAMEGTTSPTSKN